MKLTCSKIKQEAMGLNPDMVEHQFSALKLIFILEIEAGIVHLQLSYPTCNLKQKVF